MVLFPNPPEVVKSTAAAMENMLLCAGDDAAGDKGQSPKRKEGRYQII